MAQKMISVIANRWKRVKMGEDSELEARWKQSPENTAAELGAGLRIS